MNSLNIYIVISSLTVLSFFVIMRVLYVQRQNRRNAKYVYFKNSSKEIFVGSASLAGMSLFDIYSAQDNHSHFIDVIEQRFPNAMGDSSTLDWVNKIKELDDGGANSLLSYQNAYVGEQAEIESIIRLEKLGYSNVQQFESKTHANNDLVATDPSGNEIELSVKSYGDLGQFNQIVAEHPDSSHYIVNSEIYEKLQQSGQLAEYSDQGIQIIDGGFSHVEHIGESKEALDSISESLDIGDDIPIIAGAFFGVKTCKNVLQVAKGKQSLGEFGANITSDAVGVGIRSAGAGVGAKVGATVGTFILPGVGTVVGTGIGAISGFITASGFVNGFKEALKWGDILNAIEYFGDKYVDFFKNSNLELYRMEKETFINNCIDKKYSSTLLEFKNEQERLSNSISLFQKIKLKPHRVSQTLMIEHLKLVKKYLLFVEERSNLILSDLFNMIESAISNVPEFKKEFVRSRILGELIIENRNIFLENLSHEEKELIEKYDIQFKKNPNHPYRLSGKDKGILEQVIVERLKKAS